MSDDHDHIRPCCVGAERLADDGGGARIEVPGRFVGQDDGGVVHECATERDALRLPA